VMNNAEALRSLYTAHLGPQGGRVLLKQGATNLKFEDLVAAAASPEAAALVGEPVAATDPAAGAAPAAAGAGTTAAGADAPIAAGEPAPSAAEIRACVDKELRERGLNAYGDPEGTTYAGGNAPVDEYGRILYVASRNPAIRKAGKLPNF
jgi:hypothetical protein